MFNLDRIMRMVGTINNRDPVNPKPVRVIGRSERRFTPQEFLDMVPADFQTSSPPPGRKGQRGPRRAGGRAEPTANGLNLDPEAEPSMLRFAALYKANSKFRQSWEQNRQDLEDTSASAYDLSLANMAIRAGWPDQEVVNLMICFRRKHGHDLKLRENYYATTLDKAREPIEMEQAQEHLGEALFDPPEDQADVLKDNLSTLLTVEIQGITKYLGDPPVFAMKTTQGTITLGQIGNITSQNKFRDLVAAATGIFIAAVPRKMWEKRVQAILLACDDVDLGDASHPVQETRRWLEEWQKGAEAKMPFVRDGHGHVFMDNIRRWLELNKGEQLTTHTLARRLRQCDVEHKTVSLTIGGSRTSRLCWQLPEGFGQPGAGD